MQSDSQDAPRATGASSSSRKAYLALGSLLLLAAVAVAMVEIRRPSGEDGAPKKAFYTVDDGATTFVDAADRLPPFDHDGREAVRALVYTTDDGAHRWVQYLFRYTPGELARFKSVPAAAPGFGAGEVKRPGQKEWVGEMDPRAGAIMRPKAPAGAPPGEATPLFP